MLLNREDSDGIANGLHLDSQLGFVLKAAGMNKKSRCKGYTAAQITEWIKKSTRKLGSGGSVVLKLKLCN